MTYRVDVCEVPAQALLRLPRAISPDRPGADIAAGMQDLSEAVGRAGLTACGPPTITYREVGEPGTATVVEFGIPVEPAPALSLQSGAEVVVRPGILVARACHRGSYRGLGAAYRTLAQWASRNRYRAAGPATEVYLIGPDEVSDPRQLMTEIRLPVAPVPVLIARARTSFDTALHRVRDILRYRGFEILAEFGPHTPSRWTILEVCLPDALARACDADECAAVMIPHRIVVRERTGHVTVEAADPAIWAQALGNPELIAVAAGIRRRLVAVVDEFDSPTTVSDSTGDSRPKSRTELDA